MCSFVGFPKHFNINPKIRKLLYETFVFFLRMIRILKTKQLRHFQVESKNST